MVTGTIIPYGEVDWSAFPKGEEGFSLRLYSIHGDGDSSLHPPLCQTVAADHKVYARFRRGSRWIGEGPSNDIELDINKLAVDLERREVILKSDLKQHVRPRK